MLESEESSPGAKIAPEEGTEAGVAFPVVGVGASAGGLEAFTQLLGALPSTTGMAFVLVQHLDPMHQSHLSEILSRSTSMPVKQVENGLALQPDSVYIIPPNTSLRMADGRLRLDPRSADIPHSPIDHFFQSLANEQGRLAIGVILSGNGSDGTEGLRAIKEKCGITFAQDAGSARFPGMPQSAMASGSADLVLTPAEIAKKLAVVGAHPFVAATLQERMMEILRGDESELTKIFAMVWRVTGVDFSHYKQSTTRRRIGRRMVLDGNKRLVDYLAVIERNPKEAQELHRDILIGVTHFFRDPESFQSLMAYLGRRMRDQRISDTYRVWVPGCATGEEVYSLAISLLEKFEADNIHTTLKIFGTDVNEPALGSARAGRYLESIAQDVPPGLLSKYFTRNNGWYQIDRSVRDLCIFAKQDLTSDPPFSRVDLLSCRNVLIYLDQALQRTILPVFHYSLNDTGLLFLGSAETVGISGHLFETVDSKHKIYTRRAAAAQRKAAEARSQAVVEPWPVRSLPKATGIDWQKQADQLIRERYAPEGVIINQDLTVVQWRGRAGFYLQSPTGGASQNLLLLAREGLQTAIREAVLSSMTQNAAVLREGLSLEHKSEEREFNLEVVPISPANAKERYYFVAFKPTNPPSLPAAIAASVTEPETAEQETIRLKRELSDAADRFRDLEQEHEVALEEQRATNEEISSSNEELQSTNEEVSTAKEELQSTNEELITVNEELQNRNWELSLSINDLNNMFAAVNTPILMFDRGLLLRRFTPAAERDLGLSALDIGRVMSDLPPRTKVPGLEVRVREVIETLSVISDELQDGHGRWWSLTMRPYLTSDHRIEGAVLTFSDIDVVKRSLNEAEEARDYANAIVETVREPLLVLGKDFQIERANEAFYQMFQLTPAAVTGLQIFHIDGDCWDDAELRRELEALTTGSPILEGFVLEQEFPRIGRRRILVNVRRIPSRGTAGDKVLLAMEDVTAAGQIH